jgi:replicative DNA helicase
MNAERQLIAELILDNKKIPLVRSLLTDGGFFFADECRLLYDAILSAYDSFGLVDIATLEPIVVDAGLMLSDLFGISNEAITGEHAEVHARIIAEGFVRREAKAYSLMLASELDNGGDVFAILDASVKKIFGLREQFRRNQIVPMQTTARETIEYLEELWSERKPTIPFCFHEIDKITGGMDLTDLIVIAGLEKSGKSTLMIQTLFANAMRGLPVLLFSTEMTRTQIALRKALIDTLVNYTLMRNGKLESPDRERLRARINHMATLPLFIRDGVLTITEIMADAERMIRDKGIKLIAVDYIQRVIPVTRRNNENREREIAAISSGLKNLSLSMHVPVMALSQLNEDMRARESRSIEQDMDKMITIERIEDGKKCANTIDVGLKVRQRFGPSGDFGDVKLEYDMRGGFWVSPTEKAMLFRADQETF